jgi:uncharacterized membrane protein YgcG
MKPCRNAQEACAARPVSRLLGVLVLVTAGLVSPTCYSYEYPGTYYCDETNNCADVPTTFCNTAINECVCPTEGHIWCLKHSKCMPVAECFPEAGAPCHDGGSGGSGGGQGGAGGGGGSEGGAGGG